MLPNLQFPRELPITARIDAIIETIMHNQVLIVCGDTGSGKTTQLPKIAMRAGRGKRALIGCTQPRRIATVAMANYVAAEFHEAPGGLVGYQHRFDKKVSRQTILKFMTDGTLLAETRTDPLFRAYDTLIIDEAHERSLNIDFLLGILKQILPKRPDLKLIISSATLDVDQFVRFFDGAPVISVPGRLYPIETRWRPTAEDEDDLPRQIANACDEAIAAGPAGDILVFLPGERYIRDATETLLGRRLPNTEIIPLLASLPAGEQQRAFTLSPKRRIILATNVAETSVTLPGIRYVIDSGLARISRYNSRTHVQRLQVEAISQASAKQRQGRCGRIAPGLCLRLYSQADFNKRDPFTAPEIQRSKLAGVILTMLDLKLGRIENFPFIDPPSAALIREGYRELELLGALQEPPLRLTPLGRKLARFPLDPSLAAILLAAHREASLPDALIVVAALECEDPRRRPIEKQAEADACHAPFLSPQSDFAALIRLWRWYQERCLTISHSAARRLCKQNYLSWPRLRDWSDLQEQLTKLCQHLELNTTNTNGGEAGLHRALLVGLLDKIGKYNPETNDYSGCHGLRFALFPGSGLVKAKERRHEERLNQRAPSTKTKERTLLPTSKAWIVAGELIETSHLFARTAACIDPTWLESVAAHHCKYHHHSPFWDGRHGFVRVKERVTLFGLLVADGRTRDYGRINPNEARAIFIREGLIAGDFPKPLPHFLTANLTTTRQLLESEAKTRQHGALFDPTSLFQLYDAHLPDFICNATLLRRWLKAQTAQRADGTTLPSSIAALYFKAAATNTSSQLQQKYPDHIELKGERFILSYRYAPGTPEDGVTCYVPQHLLPLIATWRSDWLVPGMLPEKIRYLLTSLPTKLRRLLQPVDETVALCLTYAQPGKTPLTTALTHALHQARGVRVPPTEWPTQELPQHLRMRFCVTDNAEREIAASRDLSELVARFAPNAPSTPTPHLTSWQRDNLTQWEFGELPAQLDVGHAGWPILNYPAIVDKGTCVALRLFDNPTEALATHAKGVARLFAIALGKEWKRLTQPLALPRNVALYAQQLAITRESLGIEVAQATLQELMIADRPPIRSAQTFNERLSAARPLLHSTHAARARLVVSALHAAAEIESLLLNTPLPDTLLSDMSEQLAWLIFPGFAEATPTIQLQHLPRYLEACRVRIRRASDNPAGDLRKLKELQPFWQQYVNFVTHTTPHHHDKIALEHYRWQLEEFRVSLFAQELRTPSAISAKRLTTLWHQIFPT